MRLALAGGETLGREGGARAARKRELIRRASGTLTGSYEAGALERMRGEWRE